MMDELLLVIIHDRILAYRGYPMQVYGNRSSCITSVSLVITFF